MDNEFKVIVEELNDSLKRLVGRIDIMNKRISELENCNHDLDCFEETDYNSFKGTYGLKITGGGYLWCDKGESGYYVINGNWDLDKDGTINGPYGDRSHVIEYEEVCEIFESPFDDYNQAIDYISKVDQFKDVINDVPSDKYRPEYEELKKLPNNGYGQDKYGFLLYTQSTESLSYLRKKVRELNFPVKVIYEEHEFHVDQNEDDIPF